MSDAGVPEQVPSPDPAGLNRLVGHVEVSGGTGGTVTYEWVEGGFLMLQHVDLEQYGQRMKGLEVIGHLRPFGEEPSEHLHSRYYDTAGNAPGLCMRSRAAR